MRALESLVEGQSGAFAFGDRPSLADICLVPQMGKARRFGVELRWPRLLAILAACVVLPAVANAKPDRQPDAKWGHPANVFMIRSGFTGGSATSLTMGTAWSAHEVCRREAK